MSEMKKASKFDALVDEATAAPKGRRCHSCLDPARPAIAELMAAIHKKQAHKVGVRQMHEILCQTEKGFRERVNLHAFRMHVANHEPLWLRSKIQGSQ